MAITYTSNDVDTGASTAGSITSGTLTISTNDIVVAMHVDEDNGSAGTTTIANSGTAMTWNLIFQTNTANNCKVSAWWAQSAGNENRTVTVTTGGGLSLQALSCRVHTGADSTTPVPAGNIFNGVNAGSVSQAITPSSIGSCLWMICGDWSALNTMAGGANCTPEANVWESGGYGKNIIRPTLQPLPTSASFTIAMTTTSTAIAWVAFEVKATVTDTTAPVVTAFTLPATSFGLSVTISSFTATDAVGVTGYYVSESSATPSIYSIGWRSTAQTTYNFTTFGSKTLYAFARDAVGNISSSANASVTLLSGVSAWNHI